MYSAADLRLEAQEALERVWFVQSLEETERVEVFTEQIARLLKDRGHSA